MEFSMNGYFTEIPAKYGVSFDLATAAAAEFFETGGLPNAVDWEDN